MKSNNPHICKDWVTGLKLFDIRAAVDPSMLVLNSSTVPLRQSGLPAEVVAHSSEATVAPLAADEAAASCDTTTFPPTPVDAGQMAAHQLGTEKQNPEPGPAVECFLCI